MPICRFEVPWRDRARLFARSGEPEGDRAGYRIISPIDMGGRRVLLFDRGFNACGSVDIPAHERLRDGAGQPAMAAKETDSFTPARRYGQEHLVRPATWMRWRRRWTPNLYLVVARQTHLRTARDRCRLNNRQRFRNDTCPTPSHGSRLLRSWIMMSLGFISARPAAPPNAGN